MQLRFRIKERRRIDLLSEVWQEFLPRVSKGVVQILFWEEMITYDYKCEDCGEVQEVTIETIDILEKQPIVKARSKYHPSSRSLMANKEKLQERIDEDRICECGGKLKKLFSTNFTVQFGFLNKKRIL